MKVIDFFTTTTFDQPYDKLAQESRGPESFTTFNMNIRCRNLTSATDATLKFTLFDPYNEHIFDSKGIYADLYDSSRGLLGTYDVKALASAGTTIPITVNNGLSYYMDVRFTPEPGTLAFLGLGAATLIAGGRRKRKRAE